MNVDWLKLDKDVEAAQRAREEAMVAAFPVGSYVDYWHGSNLIRRMVVGHSDCWWVRPELLVETASGGTQCIGLYRVHSVRQQLEGKP